MTIIWIQPMLKQKRNKTSKEQIFLKILRNCYFPVVLKALYYLTSDIRIHIYNSKKQSFGN